MFANSLHQLYSANNMSLKNYAFLSLRAMGFKPVDALYYIRAAIACSIESGRDFETELNLGMRWIKKPLVF